MAITETTIRPKMADGSGGALKLVAVTFDTAYPTGGYDITTSDFSNIWGGEFIGAESLAGCSLLYKFVRASATSLKLSVWQNYDPAGAGSADRVDIEFPNGTDLSAVVADPIHIVLYGV